MHIAGAKGCTCGNVTAIYIQPSFVSGQTSHCRVLLDQFQGCATPNSRPGRAQGELPLPLAVPVLVAGGVGCWTACSWSRLLSVTCSSFRGRSVTMGGGARRFTPHASSVCLSPCCLVACWYAFFFFFFFVVNAFLVSTPSRPFRS